MVAAGFDNTLPGGCFLGYCYGPSPHPAILAGGMTPSISITYVPRPGWRFRAQYTSAQFSQVLGYRDPGEWLFLQQRVTSYSTIVMVSAAGLRLGAGPALHRTAVVRSDGGIEQRVARTKLGMTVMGGLIIPAHKRFFAEVSVQSQIVGSSPIGPYTSSDSTTTMPRTRGSFSYRSAKVGIGVRL